MAEFVQSLLGCEEHAKCFKTEVRHIYIYVSILVDPERLCFHLLKFGEAREKGPNGKDPSNTVDTAGPASARAHLCFLCSGTECCSAWLIEHAQEIDYLNILILIDIMKPLHCDLRLHWGQRGTAPRAGLWEGKGVACSSESWDHSVYPALQRLQRECRVAT